MSYYETDYAPGSVEVKVSELLICTPDKCDPLLDPAVRQVLTLLRDQHGMEAAFASEVIDGHRVSRRTQPSERAQFIDEQAEPLEVAFCKQVLTARVPAGCYLSAPVVLANGAMYGTLYSFSCNPDAALEARDVRKLEMAAQLAARLINERMAPRAAAASAPAALAASAAQARPQVAQSAQFA